MIVALIDNGSLEPAAHQNLRAVAAALSERVDVPVHAVSWKHSDRVPPAMLGGASAWTLVRWVRAQLARGEWEFVFVPFFISAQGAIGSALRGDLEKLAREAGGFEFTFTDGLAARGAIADIVTQRVRETIAARGLSRPAVIVVDHGGPSLTSAVLRDEIAAAIANHLAPASEIGSLCAASMEGSHGPLLADVLRAPGYGGDVVVAPLFLSPGRHAGPDGDVAQICRDAGTRTPGLRCHVTGLVGTHADVVTPLAHALRETLSAFSATTFA